MSDQDKALASLLLLILNCYREKHDASFREKKIELLNHLNQPDFDPQRVKSLVEQIVRHSDELSLKCQLAIECAVEELNVPLDAIPMTKADIEREASMQYAESERKIMSHESSSPSIASGECCHPAVVAVNNDVVASQMSNSHDEKDESFLPQEIKASESSNYNVADDSNGKKSDRWQLSNVLRDLRDWQRGTKEAGDFEAVPAPIVDGKGDITEVVDSSSLEAVEREETTDIDGASDNLLLTASHVISNIEPRTGIEPEEFTVDTSLFDDVICNSEAQNESLVAGIDLPLLRLVQSIVGLSFKIQDNLHSNLKNLALNFLSVLITLPTLCQIFGPYYRSESNKEATEMESAVPLTGSMASIMLFCETRSSEAKDDHQSEVPSGVIAIKKAIYLAKNGDNEDLIKERIFCSRYGDTTGVSRDAINKKVTDEDVENFINDKMTNNTEIKRHISMGRQTNKLVMHVVNLHFVAYVLWNCPISKVFEHLSMAPGCIAKLRKLAQMSTTEIVFDVNMMAGDYLMTYAAPVLTEEGQRGLAWEVACTIFSCLNTIVSVGNRASDEAKANDPRKKYLNQLIRGFETQTTTGETDMSAVIFWSGALPIHSERRLRAFRSYALQLLRSAIEKSLRTGFFPACGFSRCILRIPPSSIVELSSFITPKFFSEKQKYMDKLDGIVKKANSIEGQDTGKRTIFIQGEEQRRSLKILLDTYNKLVTSPKIRV